MRCCGCQTYLPALKAAQTDHTGQYAGCNQARESLSEDESRVEQGCTKSELTTSVPARHEEHSLHLSIVYIPNQARIRTPGKGGASMMP